MPYVKALDIKMVDPSVIDADIRKRVMSKLANIVRKHVRAETPKRTGKLRSSISKKVWDRGMQAAVYSKKPYTHLVLNGTRDHDITVRKSRVITTGPDTGTRRLAKRSLKIGADFIGPRVRVSGQSANDFFTRGAENARHDVAAAIKDSV